MREPVLARTRYGHEFIALEEDAARRLVPVFKTPSGATIRNGGKILFCGIGGSASDAQHLATELTVRYIKNRPAIAAIALTTDTSALTAIGNDIGFEYLFSRQVEAIGKQGDLLIGIST
ncbi:MAG: SIS domain-containing protein, partial [Alphaproteobacteria bacterium]|nr:SIS domain-containing protein [Alphaproteobacteria bacterium]